MQGHSRHYRHNREIIATYIANVLFRIFIIFHKREESLLDPVLFASGLLCDI